MCLGISLVTAISFKPLFAGELKPLSAEAALENYISNLYGQIDFKDCSRLSYQVFDKAYRGYLNLRNEGKLNAERQVISICDFNLPSTQNRLWVIDLAAHKVLFNTYVAHGQGSGEECATAFSNNFNSHQSSLGFYVTGDTYLGEHGISLKLNGMDKGFNDAALERGIVVHGADYVSDEFIAGNVRLGRSWGCPAVPEQLKIPIINAIAGGTCFFIYHADAKYEKKSCWLTKKVTQLPETPMFADFIQPERKPAPTTYLVQYIHNGKVDSVVTVPIANSRK